MKNTYWDNWNGILLGLVFFPIYAIAILTHITCWSYLLFHYHEFLTTSPEDMQALAATISLPFIITGLALLIHYIPGGGDRCCAILISYDDRIKWICPGYRSVTLKYDEIEYLRVDNLDNEVSAGMTFRGDETTYIYMSQHPYPGKYIGKVTRIRSKKGTIRFKYSDRLCEDLVRHLPNDKCIALKAFYYKMQAHDEQERKRKEQEKRKKLRKKQNERARREKEKNRAKKQNNQ